MGETAPFHSSVPCQLTLSALNRMSPADFRKSLSEALGFPGELPGSLEGQRPFADLEALRQAIVAGIATSDLFAQLAWFRLCAAWAAETLAQANQVVEGSAALEATDADAPERQALEQVYREKFGFPYVPPVVGDSGASGRLHGLRRGLAQALDVEFGECLMRAQGWVANRLPARVGQG